MSLILRKDFFKLFEQQDSKRFLKESISQRNLWQIIIQLLNPQVIFKLITSGFEYYQTHLQEKYKWKM
ncbi:unnamed protein product [Paramecium octaurelia]|uniref:Uncharacterized protein n=1 Tax=Paramecium octaurelia TaxID=43137 RepID=A0A8S1YRK8_PAROT|nr:unnamed protein product [Paramecium octaurelia]